MLIVTGDAYVDHPAFGPVIIARVLESKGLRVGIVAQPRWETTDDVLRMGRPRLFVGVSAGNLDSMLNKLTAQKKVRSSDEYSPGGRTGMRPNRASIVYANLCRRAFPGLPVVIGGIEASLRRIAHYDYWEDAVRRAVLLDAKGHLLVYGMGERAIVEIAERLGGGEKVETLRDVRGTAYVLANPELWRPLVALESRHVSDSGVVVLPSFEQVRSDHGAFAQMTRLVELESNPRNARRMVQLHGDEAVVINPPALPLSEQELDAVHAMPFLRAPHPGYEEPIPAFETVRHSVVTHRGCFGGCAFCSITQHEGRTIQSRSARSVLQEVRDVATGPRGAGVISDLGGPTANMYRMGCRDPRFENACRRPSCVYPKICSNLNTDHKPLIDLLRSARTQPGVRHVHVASGIRYDLALCNPAYVAEIARHHTGGQLSVAPEHVDPRVLHLMRKPGIAAFEQFAARFGQESDAAGKQQFLVPYLIVAHPGSTFADTIELALYLKRRGLQPRQVQEFIPTPMTIATAMHHTGLDPMTGERVTSVKDLREKKLLKALVLWWDETQWPHAREALRKAARVDLIGEGERKLVPSPGGAAKGNRDASQFRHRQARESTTCPSHIRNKTPRKNGR